MSQSACGMCNEDLLNANRLNTALICCVHQRHVVALTMKGIQGRKCAPLEDIIHRTMKAYIEARWIDSLHALQRLFVLNVMMSRCDDACLPGIEHCRATGDPVP